MIRKYREELTFIIQSLEKDLEIALLAKDLVEISEITCLKGQIESARDFILPETEQDEEAFFEESV